MGFGYQSEIPRSYRPVVVWVVEVGRLMLSSGGSSTIHDAGPLARVVVSPIKSLPVLSTTVVPKNRVTSTSACGGPTPTIVAGRMTDAGVRVNLLAAWSPRLS